ncbi:hypothetical protein TNCV_2616641 [Trichonephila clavipes]|nr:hypothetical protein TNCV_2616641 [Trichonephila clavipes]
MSPNTSECTRSTCSLNQWVSSLVGLFTSAGTGEYFSLPFSSLAEIVEVEIEVVSPSIVPSGSFTELKSHLITCMVLKANDRRTSCPCHDEFRGPRSDYVRHRFAIPDLYQVYSTFPHKSHHKPGLDLQTTVPGKCPSSPEDEQEKEGERGTDKERL